MKRTASQIGWVLPMVMGVAAAGTLFAFAASRSLAADGASRTSTQCLSTPLETTRVVDDQTLFVQDRSGKAAVVTMTRDCLHKGETLGFEFSGAASLCRPVDFAITTGLDRAVPVRCMVKSVKLLTREEAREWSGR